MQNECAKEPDKVFSALDPYKYVDLFGQTLRAINPALSQTEHGKVTKQTETS